MKALGEPDSCEFRALFFGTFKFQRGTEVLTLPPSANSRSLLAFLCLNRRHPHNRSTLTGIFWPEMSEERARRALSQALWQIRRNFPGLLDIHLETIAISKGLSLWVDAEIFEALVKPALDAAPLDERARQNLERALEFFGADFLEDDYHDWALLERERLRELYLQALEQLGQLEKAAGRYAKALDLALRLARAEPSDEAAHREIMRLYQLLGQPEAAARQFELCRQILRQELGVEPEAETIALAEELSRRVEISQTAIASGNQMGNLSPAPLVGRAADRAALLHFVDGIFNQLGGLVLVEGEAGVGKTRLLQEVARDAGWRGAQVLWGNAREAQGLKPYAPLVDAVRSGLSPLRVTQIQQMVERVWLQSIFPLLSAHPAIPALEPAPALPPAPEQARLVEAIVRFLAGWREIVPLVLIIEDLHWADQNTLDLLPTLARRLSPFGILLIASYRAEEARTYPRVWQALQDLDRGNLLDRRILTRLEPAATAELIRRSLALAAPAPLFEERLHRETDGNPLFILETLRSLQDEGLLQRDENGGWSTPWDETTLDYAELPLPPLVEKVITARLGRLPGELRHLLEGMAVLGSRFDFTTLTAISDLDVSAVLGVARELIQRSFLRETENGYRFEHDKIHQVVYEGIAAEKRLEIHRRIATHLAQVCPIEPDVLAYHFWRGEAWEQAALYNQRAAEAAIGLHANREARMYLTRALDALDKLPACPAGMRRADLLQARVTVNGLLGDRAAQKADLDQLDGIMSDPAGRAQQSLRWASYYEVISDYPSAIRAAQQAAELAAGQNDLSTQAAAQIVWGRILNIQAEPQATQSILTCALENARAAKNTLQEVVCLHALARFYYDHQNCYMEALACCRAALDIVQILVNREMEANIRHMMGNIFSDLGRMDEARQEKLVVLRLRREIGDRRGEAMILYSLAVYYRDRCEHETSLKYTRESLVIAEAIGDQRLEAYDRTYLGLLLEERDPHESLKQYARALEIRRQIGQPAVTVDTLAGLARACLQLDQVQQAEAYISEALQWVDAHGTFGVGDISLIQLAAYRVFTAAGHHQRARQIIQTAYDGLMARAMSLPDEDAKRIFLTGAPQHNQIIDCYRKSLNQRVAVRLPRAGSPEETVEVLWTLSTPEDEAISEKVARRRQRLQRLLGEAAQQGGSPTHQHLADALGAGLRTIERDLAELKKN